MFRAIIKKSTFTGIPGPGNRLSSGVNLTTAKKIKTGRRFKEGEIRGEGTPVLQH